MLLTAPSPTPAPHLHPSAPRHPSPSSLAQKKKKPPSDPIHKVRASAPHRAFATSPPSHPSPPQLPLRLRRRLRLSPSSQPGRRGSDPSSPLRPSLIFSLIRFPSPIHRRWRLGFERALCGGNVRASTPAAPSHSGGAPLHEHPPGRRHSHTTASLGQRRHRIDSSCRPILVDGWRRRRTAAHCPGDGVGDRSLASCGRSLHTCSTAATSREMENCDNKMEPYQHRCFYQSGEYSSEDRFAELDRKLKEKETMIDHLKLSTGPNVTVGQGYYLKITCPNSV